MPDLTAAVVQAQDTDCICLLLNKHQMKVMLFFPVNLPLSVFRKKDKVLHPSSMWGEMKKVSEGKGMPIGWNDKESKTPYSLQ